MVETSQVAIHAQGNGDMHDLTSEAKNALKKSGAQKGLVNVFVVGSTAGITTIEFEPGLVQDMKVAMERLAPENGRYAHEERWNDDNGHSHVRASTVGPSICVPVVDGELLLGTWQQIVLIDFDTRPRDRTIFIQVIGE
jgi:secondary thiamine-phosphate synthase enzyme